MSESLHLVEPPEEDGHYIPPHDLAAERAVIGSALVSRRALEEVADLDPADFYRPAHEVIWRTVRELSERGEAVDTITVPRALEAAGRSRQAGGVAYIHDCANSVPVATNVTTYARIVADRATLRRVIEAGTRIVTIGQSGIGEDPLSVVGQAREALDSLATRDDEDALPTPDAVKAAVDALSEPPGIPTPWRDLTTTIAGWKPGNVYVVGARPSVGKSIAGVQAALDVARRGKTAIFLSMEMSSPELFHRMFCHVGGVDATRVQNRELTQEDWRRVHNAAEQIAPLPLVVDDRSHLSIAQARSVVRRAQRTSDVGLVVVDYIGLMKSTGRHGSREQEVAAFSRGLKLLAKDLGVPVLVLAQVNRGPEQRGGDSNMPMLSDLRESGQIEADADVVIMLHRDMGPDADGTILFLVRKNRHGPRTQIQLAFRGHHSTISDMHDPY